MPKYPLYPLHRNLLHAYYFHITPNLEVEEIKLNHDIIHV